MGRRMTPEVDSFPEATQLANLTMRLKEVTKTFRQAMEEYIESPPAGREAMHPLLGQLREQLRESKTNLRTGIDTILFGEDA